MAVATTSGDGGGEGSGSNNSSGKRSVYLNVYDLTNTNNETADKVCLELGCSRWHSCAAIETAAQCLEQWLPCLVAGIMLFTTYFIAGTAGNREYQ